MSSTTTPTVPSPPSAGGAAAIAAPVPAPAAAPVPPPPAAAVSVDVLAAAALKGELLFTETHGEDYASALAKALAAAGVTHQSGARPAAAPADLARLLGHPEAGDVALAMLFELVVSRARSAGLPLLGLREANMNRLPFVDLSFMAALLVEYERRASALAAQCLGAGAAIDASKAAAGKIGNVADLILFSHVSYDNKLLAPAVRGFGFERFHRAHVLAAKAVAAADPLYKVTPHLRVSRLWDVMYESVYYYWDVCKSGMSAILVVDELEKSVAPVATALAEAFLPLAMSEDPLIYKDSMWASGMVYICDLDVLASAFAAAGGMAPLLREATDPSSKTLNSLLIAVNNAARFSGPAQAMMELNAPRILAPLVYSSNAKTAAWACINLCFLALHPELAPRIEATGALADVLVVQRSMMDVGGDVNGFAAADIAARMALTHKDSPIALRLSGARELLWYVKGARATAASSSSASSLEMLKTMGVVERARELAVDGDAFLYVHAVNLLGALGLPTPYFRDKSEASGGASTESTVLAWTIEDVCSWVGRHPFRMYRTNFRESLVDGASLSTLTDAELVEMGVASALHRKAIRASVGRLLEKAGLRYEHAPAPAGANAGAGGEAHHALSPMSPRRVASSAGYAEEEEYVDVFLSYRRKTGAVLAQLLSMHFKAAGLKVFLDVENLGTGAFDVALKAQLMAARNVVVVLSEGALDRCLDDHEGKDFVRKEIAMSLMMDKNVVPVICDDFKWPETEALPEDMRALPSRNGIPWSHMWQDACVSKLISFLKLSS